MTSTGHMILALTETGAVALGTAGIAAVASTTGLWFSRGAKREARQANAAVNNVNSGEPRLIEQVHNMDLRLVGLENVTGAMAKEITETRDDVRMITNHLLGDKRKQ